MVLVHDKSSYCALQLYKFHLNNFNCCQLTERTRNCIANDQREITPKIFKPELWFLCMTHCLIVLYNCMKFHFYSFNGCQLTERTGNCIANDQREITPKIYKAELWFLCTTHLLIVLYICMKFHLNNLNGCQLTERTRNSIANDQREIQCNSKNIQSRVMVLVHDTSSQCDLQLYDVSL